MRGLTLIGGQGARDVSDLDELPALGVSTNSAEEYDRARPTVDARIGGYPDRTIVNVGAEHAQKSPLLGPPQEWLGDYLVHRSDAVSHVRIQISILGLVKIRE